MKLPAHFDSDKLQSIIGGFAGCRILLVGDLVADHYIRGKSSRISREAPVLILKYQDESVIPGQVGNTAANIAALGGVAMVVGMIGNDSRGEQLLAALSDSGVDTSGIFRSATGATITKTRVLAGGHHTARQQVIRIDDDDRLVFEPEDHVLLLEYMRKAGTTADAIIVSDYGYGAINDTTWNLARNLAQQHNIPLVLDSRYHLPNYQGATLITPNEEEALAAGSFSADIPYDIEAVGKKVREVTRCENLIITRGNEGMVLFCDGNAPVHLPIFGSDECTDVTGAGDTVVATATLALATGAAPVDAMTLSNLSGAIVVMKMGTATVDKDELIHNLSIICEPK